MKKIANNVSLLVPAALYAMGMGEGWHSRR